MEEIIIKAINYFGYIGIGTLMALENIFPPIPSEIILTFGGSLTTLSGLNVWGVITAATIGSSVGASALYCLGRSLDSHMLAPSSGIRFGKALILRTDDVEKAERWFAKYGAWAVLYCRFIPIVRSLISIPAGLAEMRLAIFLPLTMLGTLLWNAILVYLGRCMGDAWRTAASIAGRYSTAAVSALALAALLVIHVVIRNRRQAKRKS